MATTRSTTGYAPVRVDPSATAPPGATPIARRTMKFCTMREEPPQRPLEGVSPNRAKLIRTNANKWVNGTVLRYYFFDRDSDGETVRFTDGSTEFRTWKGPSAQQQVVRSGFQSWMDVGIGIRFEEVMARDNADVRIGFQPDDGAWSYIGRDVLEQGRDERTMNFGWDLTSSPSEIDTAVHEIGHTLGFPHEHQNPNTGIEWDEEAVYAALAQPPNSWDRATTFHNIIRKIPAYTVQGSNWDPDSIMHYPFEPGLILRPPQFNTSGIRPAGGISGRDREWVKMFYPANPDAGIPTLKPFESKAFAIAAGQQVNFLIHPTTSRMYDIQTFGESDTVAVLFEDVNGQPVRIAADDDSGTDRNAHINIRLLAGRKYTLRVRLYYANRIGETAVMLW